MANAEARAIEQDKTSLNSSGQLFALRAIRNFLASISPGSSQ